MIYLTPLSSISSRIWLFLSILVFVYYVKAGVSHLKEPHFEPNLRIINGNAAVAHSAPYMAALVTIKPWNATTNATSFCGGTLITPNYVLTAAHCFPNVTAVRVVLGAHLRGVKEPTRLTIQVDRPALIPHEKYVENTKHEPYDIGLIKLSSPVTYNQYIQPVTLPTTDKEDYYSTKGRIYGWGDIDIPPKPSLPKELMYADLDITSNATCQAQSYTVDHEVCLDVSKGTGTCKGDSGGPLMVAGVQVGVISAGTGNHCDDGSAYTLATNVNKFIQWIRDNSDWTGQ